MFQLVVPVFLPISAKLASMDTVKIDRFGRVLIPKKVRKRLGLEAGQAFQLTVEGGKVTLEPREQGTTLVRKGQALVFEGKLTGRDVDYVEEMREERYRAILGDSND